MVADDARGGELELNAGTSAKARGFRHTIEFMLIRFTEVRSIRVIKGVMDDRPGANFIRVA